MWAYPEIWETSRKAYINAGVHHPTSHRQTAAADVHRVVCTVVRCRSWSRAWRTSTTLWWSSSPTWASLTRCGCSSLAASSPGRSSAPSSTCPSPRWPSQPRLTSGGGGEMNRETSIDRLGNSVATVTMVTGLDIRRLKSVARMKMVGWTRFAFFLDLKRST